MALTKIDDRGLKTPIDLQDNEKIRLGTGNDLELYHNGSHSYLDEVGTGNLNIRSEGLIELGTITGPEACLKAYANGAVELYHNNSKKLETTSYGVSTDGLMNFNGTGGKILVADEGKITFGGGNDLEIYHDGSHSDIHDSGSGNLRLRSSKVQILNEAATEQIANFIPDGPVQLYYDNSKKLETASHGLNITDGELRIGDASDGNDASIRLGATGTNVDTHAVIKYDKDDNWLSMVVAGESHGVGGILIANGGNVGIGTASPSNVLDVQGGTSNTAIVARSTDSKAQISLVDNSTTGVGSVVVGAEGDALFFTSGSGGSERMRIDSSGRLLLGTTTQGHSNADDLTVNNSGNCGITIRSGSSNDGNIFFADADSDTIGTLKYDHTNNAFRINTNGSERMRIDSSGKLFIGTTSTSSVEDGSTNSQYFSGGTRVSSRDNTSNREHLVFYNPNGDVGSINTSGSATSYTTSSDYRLKENVVAISDGITRLKTLKPSRFNFKVDKDTTVDGFLAHEVTAVPEAITGTKDAVDSDNKPIYQGIDQSKLVPLLTAALKEAITKIETLETKVAALEAA